MKRRCCILHKWLERKIILKKYTGNLLVHLDCVSLHVCACKSLKMTAKCLELQMLYLACHLLRVVQRDVPRGGVPCSLTHPALGPLALPSPWPLPPHSACIVGERKEGVWRLKMIYLRWSPWPWEGQVMSTLWSLQPKNIKHRDKSYLERSGSPNSLYWSLKVLVWPKYSETASREGHIHNLFSCSFIQALSGYVVLKFAVEIFPCATLVYISIQAPLELGSNEFLI